ncbi:hypothetical protein M513_04479 [Trichuris suis]|uniref:Uncharacterized protein n=1 Tax=Trichuris suis TaxID=68888 RepID=A0A085MC33_9BILA|nr:hypothetical protein M513_04479 [Trichuris suis]
MDEQIVRDKYRTTTNRTFLNCSCSVVSGVKEVFIRYEQSLEVTLFTLETTGLRGTPDRQQKRAKAVNPRSIMKIPKPVTRHPVFRKILVLSKS